MANRNLVPSGVSSLLLSIVRYSVSSVLLVTVAYLLQVGYVSVLPFIKPQLRPGVPIKIPHHYMETEQRLAPASYRTDARGRFVNISPPHREGNVTTRNTVAVVLNWSRFPNVRRIVSLLCSPELDSFMKRVLVWNNSQKPLTYLVRNTIFSSTLRRPFELSNTVTRTLSRPLVRRKS